MGRADEEGEKRWHELTRSRREQERPGLAVGARQGLDVEAADSLPDLAAPAINDAMASRHQSVEVAVHRLPRPIALGASEVGGRAPVQRGHRQHLRGSERVHVTGAGAGHQIFEPVPVVAAEGDEILRSPSLIVSYLTMWTSRFRTPTSSLPPLNGCRSTTRSPASATVRSRRSSTC